MQKNNGMDVINASIRKSIENRLSIGQRNFIIFPFGDIGMRVKNILNMAYGVEEKAIVDNNLCKYNKKIHSSMIFEEIRGGTDVCVMLATINPCIYEDLKKLLCRYFPDDCIEELDVMAMQMRYPYPVGKYSYGPLASGNYQGVESVGSFCSFAFGSDVVLNHATDYITTHPMIDSISDNSCMYSDEAWYFPGVLSRGVAHKATKSKIGNDVWLGRNVIITNGANIGNGVIAAAGAVITKDVPDYAVVAGVPAKIVKYRYTQKQIDALNKIAWWDWSDEEIRDRFDDFYLPVDDFIKKYLL